MILIQTDNLYICKSFLTDFLKEPVHISHWLMNQTNEEQPQAELSSFYFAVPSSFHLSFLTFVFDWKQFE